MMLYGASASSFLYLAKQIARDNSRFDVHYVRTKHYISRSQSTDSTPDLSSLFSQVEGKLKLIFFYLLDALYITPLSGEDIQRVNNVKRDLPTQLKSVLVDDNDCLAVVASARKPWKLPENVQSSFQRWTYVGLAGPEERINLIKAHIGRVKCSLNDQNYIQLARMTEDYTYSELGNIVEEAHLGPFKRIEAATHFRRSSGHWVPSSPSVSGSVELAWHTLKPTEVQEPLVYDDLLEGFQRVERRRTDKHMKELGAVARAHPDE